MLRKPVRILIAPNAFKHSLNATDIATEVNLVNSIDFFLAFTNFEKALNLADLVITGEGNLDEQTLHGKGPFGVAFRALPVIGIAGNVPLEPNEALNQYFDVLLSIGNGPASIHTAIQLTRQNLRQIGNILAIAGSTNRRQ